jgi:hypothetical protein
MLILLRLGRNPLLHRHVGCGRMAEDCVICVDAWCFKRECSIFSTGIHNESTAGNPYPVLAFSGETQVFALLAGVSLLFKTGG